MLDENEIRKYAYRVLLDNYPDPMSESQIADMIRYEYEGNVSKCLVHNALCDFARSCEHFSIVGKLYTVNKLEEPFTQEIPKKHPFKRITLADIDIKL